MRLRKPSEIILPVLLMAMSVVMVGCVVCKTDETYTGVEKSQLKQVECGKTTKSEVIAALGEPSEQSMTEDGIEVLKYKCTRQKDNAFVMFPPPIVIKDDKAVEHLVAVEIKDGIVQRYWKEK